MSILNIFHPKKHTELERFLLIGVLNTLFGYSCYAFFIFLGLNYALALLLSTGLGILFNFKTIGIFVFKSSVDNMIFLKFLMVYGFIYIINASLITCLEFLTDNLYWAGFFVIFPAAALSFILNKYVVFNKKTKVI